jgi:general secretion pathway protein G
MSSQSTPPGNPAQPPPVSAGWSDSPTDPGAPAPKKKSWVLWIVLGGAGCVLAIVLLGIVATIIVPNLWMKSERGQQVTAHLDLMKLRIALESYAQSHDGEYPDSLEALMTPDAEGRTAWPDQNGLPLDPWGHAYVYEPPGPGENRPKLCSYGRDGKPGGSGPDADIDGESKSTRDH